MKFRYTPVLRAKEGEATALANLDAKEAKRLRPLVVLPTKPGLTFNSTLAPAWKQLPLALDGGYNFGVTGSTAVFVNAFRDLGKHGLAIIPAVAFDSPAPYINAVSPLIDRYAPGLLLRAKPADLPNLNSWIATQQWSPADIDLVVDVTDVANYEESVLQQVVTQSLITHLGKSPPWRSITLAASAAPRDFGGLPPGRTLVPRRDWRLWQHVSANVPFPLHYGDYGALHPSLDEPPPYVMGKASVSARYTTDDNWILLKGAPTSGKTGKPMRSQYTGHAKALVADPKFGGLANCWGDSRIQATATGTPGGGSRSKWAGFTMNRHVSLVCNRLP